VVFATLRTGLAISQIVKYSQYFDKLPFISPLLWIDWVVVAQVWGGKYRKFALPIVLFMYVFCFWLCVGYCFLKYGTRQYEVLEIPKKCEPPPNQTQISWQTDPRRKSVLDLHCVIFGLASWGLLEGFSAYQKAKAIDTDRVWYFYGHEVHKLLSLGLGVAVLICLATGAVLVGLLNEKEYLFLSQHKCYASYVSGRFSYVKVDVLDWVPRIGEWLGLGI
jgi:hypothetical protein